MEHMVTITRQGQLTIPQTVRKHFGIRGSTKAVLKTEGYTLIVEPKNDFWSLSGSLKSRVKLTNAQLTNARRTFAKRWARVV